MMYNLGWVLIADEESRRLVMSAMPDAPVIPEARSRGRRRPRRERRFRRRSAAALHCFGGVTSPAANPITKEGPCAT